MRIRRLTTSGTGNSRETTRRRGRQEATSEHETKRERKKRIHKEGREKLCYKRIPVRLPCPPPHSYCFRLYAFMRINICLFSFTSICISIHSQQKSVFSALRVFLCGLCGNARGVLQSGFAQVPFTIFSDGLPFVLFQHQLSLIARSRDLSGCDVRRQPIVATILGNSYAPAGYFLRTAHRTRSKSIPPRRSRGKSSRLPPTLVPRRCIICYSKRFSSRIVHTTLYDITLYDYYQRYGKIIQLRLQLMPLLLVR